MGPIYNVQNKKKNTIAGENRKFISRCLNGLKSNVVLAEKSFKPFRKFPEKIIVLN